MSIFYFTYGSETGKIIVLASTQLEARTKAERKLFDTFKPIIANSMFMSLKLVTTNESVLFFRGDE